MTRKSPLYSIVIALHPTPASTEHLLSGGSKGPDKLDVDSSYRSPNWAKRDYRFGDLSIDWIDYDSEKQIAGILSQGDGDGSRVEGNEPSIMGSGDGSLRGRIKSSSLATSLSSDRRETLPSPSLSPPTTDSQPASAPAPDSLSSSKTASASRHSLLAKHFQSAEQPERRSTRGTTELGPGIFHLFKHAPPLTILESLEADLSFESMNIQKETKKGMSGGGHNVDPWGDTSRRNHEGQNPSDRDESESKPAEGADGTLIAILALPVWMDTSSFVDWLGAWTTCLEGLRMLRDASPNKTIGLLKFKDVQEATDFVSIYTGKNFAANENGQQTESCHPLRIHHLVIQNLDANFNDASPAAWKIAPSDLVVPLSSSSRKNNTIIPSERPLAPSFTQVQPHAVSSNICDPAQSIPVTPARLLRGIPSRSITELPTCPVCLERMDSIITGLITTPCTHVFNCKCLDTWGNSGNSGCPVCMYSHRALSVSSSSSPSDKKAYPECYECQGKEDDPRSNWICVLCGYVGCNRYRKGHARDHFLREGHVYAMEIDTQRVWDYMEDSYVHRLIQNRSDGKVVELPSAASLASHHHNSSNLVSLDSHALFGAGPSRTDERKMSDIERITFEYSSFLSAQLEQQRGLHEAETRAMQRELREMKRKIGEGEEWRRRLVREEEKRKSIENSVIPDLQSQKVQAEKKAQRATELAKRLADDLKSERAIGSGLMEKTENLQRKLNAYMVEQREAKAKIEELEEMMKDLMFSLEAQETMKGSEAAGGDLVLRPNPNLASSNRRKTKR